VSSSIAQSACTRRTSSRICRNGGRPSSERNAPASAREPFEWWLSSGAMDAGVGDLAHPPDKMGLERRPTDKLVTSERIVFDVAHAALVFALGARPI
jgi:hypothetical protein